MIDEDTYFNSSAANSEVQISAVDIDIHIDCKYSNSRLQTPESSFGCEDVSEKEQKKIQIFLKW